MKKTLLLLALSFYIFALKAQTISGVVKDLNNQPISFATVILYSLPDSVQVNYAVTNDKGFFKLESQEQKDLLLQVSFVGYKTYLEKAKAHQDIVLEEDALVLGEVVVKGNRPVSKITPQGVKTLVANTVLSDMGTGNEVLKRIPMVTGSDGNFKVLGRGEAVIYINNRKVRDKSELDNINAKEIKNVEVITNPGARYDATVTAVIRIKTVKKQGDGFSFNVRSSYYRSENNDFINQLKTNYRSGGLDLSANVYYLNETSRQEGDLFQEVHVDTLWTQQSFLDSEAKINQLKGTFSANYEINENHYVGFRYDIKGSLKDNTVSNTFTSDVEANGVSFDQWKNDELKEIDKKPTSQLNLYYSGKLDKLSIDLNADYLNQSTATSALDFEESDLYGNRTLRSTSDIDNRLFAAKLQLTYPVWRGAFVAGSEYVDLDRADQYLNEDLEGFSSRVDVAEQNLALFVEYQASTKLGDFSAGVRYEDASFNYLVNHTKDSDKSRDYQQWFANASYSKRIGEVGLQLSYNSKVLRPTYAQLSNNLTYANRLTIETGNPYLKPTTIHDLSLTGVWRFLQAQVSYAKRKDIIVSWIERYENDPKISIIKYRNLEKLPKLTAVLTAAPSIGFWNPQLTVGIQKQWIDLEQYGVDAKLNDPLYFVIMNNTFDLPHHYIVNLDMQCFSKGHVMTNYNYRNTYMINAGVTKSFLDKSLQVKLAVTDLLNSKNATIAQMPKMELRNLYKFDNRNFSITLRYYFNSAKSKYKGSGAGREAKDRF